MGLFEVIKYQATDLTSEEELVKLPEEIINLYLIELRKPRVPSFRMSCHVLSILPLLQHNEDIDFRKCFINALKKYNP
jgi:hypothetical protein